MLRASAVAVPPKRWFTRASDASPWWLGLPALAGCGSLPRPNGLRCSLPHPPRHTGRSDLCSRHQHGSADQSSCFVIRVTQLRQISQVCRKLARGSRSVALAATHGPQTCQWWQFRRCSGCRGMLRGRASVRSQESGPDAPLLTPGAEWCRVELCVCDCVRAGDVLSSRAGLRAISSYD